MKKLKKTYLQKMKKLNLASEEAGEKEAMFD